MAVWKQTCWGSTGSLRHYRTGWLRMISSATAGGASQAAGAMLGHFGEISKFSLATEPGREKFRLGALAPQLWPDMRSAPARVG
jgi:hypothetical protein